MHSVWGPVATCVFTVFPRHPRQKRPWSHHYGFCGGSFCALTVTRTANPKSPGRTFNGHPTQKKKSAHKEKEGTMEASPTPGAQGPHPTAAIMQAFYRSEGWAAWIGRLCNLRHEMRLHQLLDEWEQKCLRQQRLELKGGQT